MEREEVVEEQQQFTAVSNSLMLDSLNTTVSMRNWKGTETNVYMGMYMI